MLTVCAIFLPVVAGRAGQSQGFDDQLWRVSEGLPNSQVRALAQSADGLLWVGTLEGLAAFDGLKFTTIEPRTLRQMSRQHFLALTIGPDRSIWFSNGHGLSRHQDGKISYYSLSNGLPSTYVLSLFCNKAGDIFAGTDRGVRKLKDGLFVPLLQNDPIGPVAVRAILEDDQGSLWIGCSNGLVKIENHKLVRATTEQGTFPKNSILSLAKGTNGTIWVGTGAGLTRIDASGSTNYTMAHGL